MTLKNEGSIMRINLSKSNLKKVALIIFSTVLGIYYIFIKKIYISINIFVIYIIVLALILIFGLIYINKRKVARIEKGRKLYETHEYPLWNRVNQIFLLIYSLSILSMAVISLYEIVYKNSNIDRLIPLFVYFPAVIFSIISPRKVDIYERGIKRGLRFIRWRDIESYRRDKDMVEIRIRGFLGGLVLRDEKGEVTEILGKKL